MRSHYLKSLRLLLLGVVVLGTPLIAPRRSDADDLNEYRAFGAPRTQQAKPAPNAAAVARSNQPNFQPRTVEEVNDHVARAVAAVRAQIAITEQAGSAGAAPAAISSTAGATPSPPISTPPSTSVPRERAQAPRAALGLDSSKPMNVEIDRVPNDPRFRQFQKQLRERVRLTVVVNGSERTHLNRVLSGLARVSNRSEVVVDQVLVTGSPAVAAHNLQQLPQASLPSSPASLRGGAVSRELIGGLKLRYSPAWIVTYQGKQWVFEGVFDPATFL